jgi:thiosulfate dehydrogenase (quinone) large subunit
MMDSKVYTKLQLITLVTLRVLIGWHLLYEGVSKLLTPGWSSVSFLRESQWIMSGCARWIISHGSVLATVDFMNVWGLIAIGLGLILGLCTRLAAISGAVLVLIYYLNNAPIIGIEYSIPAEGNNLIVSKTLIEAVALLVLTVFPTGSIVGLDVFIARFKNIKKNIK